MEKVNEVVEAVSSNREIWPTVDNKERLSLLLDIQNIADSIAEEWAATSAKIRNIKTDGSTPHLEGSAWMTGVGTTGSILAPLIESYRSVVETGKFLAPVDKRTVNGQHVLTVYPQSLKDKISNPVRAEVWLEPGATLEQGKTLEERGVCCILGAGNFEAPTDVLTKLFIENKVVVYKPNPVNELNGPILEKVLKPLIDRNFVRIITGGVDVGAALVNHPKVEEILITGGASSYDRIVWGPPSEQAQRKAKGEKVMTKRIDAELGGVSPILIVPGPWTPSEIEHHAKQIAAVKLSNGGHICCCIQVIVTDSTWPQRQAFLDAVKKNLAAAPSSCVYYPYTKEKMEKVSREYPTAENVGGNDTRLIVFGADPQCSLTKEEMFCPVLAEVSLEGKEADPTVFLTKAVDYCNDSLNGSLSMSILLHPKSEKQVGSLDPFVSKLRYGTIGINCWGGIVNFLPMPWGAFPGHKDTDIQSGKGKINNIMLLDRPEKSVVYSPFVSPSHLKTGVPGDKKVFSRLAWYSMKPSGWRLISVVSGLLFGV